MRMLALALCLLIACDRAEPAPLAPQVVSTVAPMAAWAADPLVAATDQPTTCAALATLAAQTQTLPPSQAVARVRMAIAHFQDSCQAYSQALTVYPLARLRWERYWRDSLAEGAMVASDYWRDETRASEARLAQLEAQWRAAARAAEQERSLGCAALAPLGVAPEQVQRACP